MTRAIEKREGSKKALALRDAQPIAADDSNLTARRERFKDHLRRHVEPILNEGGVYSTALNELTDEQRVVFFGAVLEWATVAEFGRQPSEQTRWSQPIGGRPSPLDPIVQGFAREFRRVGIKDGSYMDMIPNAAQNLRVAYRQDPLLHDSRILR